MITEEELFEARMKLPAMTNAEWQAVRAQLIASAEAGQNCGCWIGILIVAAILMALLF